MISLKCTRCGREIQVSDAVRGMEIPCARCGQVLIVAPPAGAAGTELGMMRIDSTAVMMQAPDGLKAADPPPTGFSDDDETLTPLSSGHADSSYLFLSAPKEPGELGWLAHYRVLRLLGKGGMAFVFEAVDTHLQRTVALKVMKPSLARDESARQRFLREARATAALKSEHIVTIHQIGEKNKVPFIAMEFLHGESLDRRLERGQRLTLEEILRLGIDTARGLTAAHERGLIHRDIKPGNIWLESAGAGQDTEAISKSPESEHQAPTEMVRMLPGAGSLPVAFRVKILDFGLARFSREASQLTQTGFVMGTPAYMAPEQAEGKDVDASCDLFSFGCVLYELATGEQPFSGVNSMAILMAVVTKDPRPPLEIKPDLPPLLANLILQLLEKNPKNRPASARKVVEMLETIAASQGVFRKTPPGETTRRRIETMTALTAPRRRRWPIPVFAVAALLVIGSVLAWEIAAILSHNRSHETNPAVQGVTDTEILLGMTGPFNGPAKELGHGLKLGLETYFQHVNAGGGVADRKIRLVHLDDEFDAQRSLANIRELYEKEKVFAIIGNIGAPTTNKEAPYGLDKPLLFFCPYTGAKLLRQTPPDRYVFHYRASLEEESAALVNYLVKTRGIHPDQVAVFAQDDLPGDDAYHSVVKALRQRDPDLREILRTGYARNTTHVDDAVQAVLRKPLLKAVVVVTAYKPAARFIRMVKDAAPHMVFAAASFVDSDALAEELRETDPQYADGIIVSQVVPPIHARTTLVVRYHEMLKKYQPSERPSFISLEGYIDAVLLTAGLKRAGTRLTTETLIDALEDIRGLDVGLGDSITFSPSEHQASHRVWLTQIDKDGNCRPIVEEE